MFPSDENIHLTLEQQIECLAHITLFNDLVTFAEQYGLYFFQNRTKYTFIQRRNHLKLTIRIPPFDEAHQFFAQRARVADQRIEGSLIQRDDRDWFLMRG